MTTLAHDAFARSLAAFKALKPKRDYLAEIREQTEAVAAEVQSLPIEQREQVISEWGVLMIDPQLEPDPYARALIGRVLGLLDADKRTGIGLGADGLPDVEWITIPAGDFVYGEDEKRTLPAYSISRYHITHPQFQAFVDAPDGFADPRWWEGLPKVRELPELQSKSPQQTFQYSNHPYDGASWIDMMAFCRWWSYRLGGEYASDKLWLWKVRPPTEVEWEKAARGTDGRIYPWGNEFISGYANFDEVDRFGFQKSHGQDGHVGEYFYGGAMAVGLFPQGASPYGVMDMIGNLWDMTVSLLRPNKDEDLSDHYPRIIRGGTWFVGENYCRANVRTAHQLHVRFYDYGFRVVTTPSTL